MNSSAQATPPGDAPRAPRRHVIMAAVSLAILSILVIGPITLILVLLWGAALTLAGAGTLFWVGALEEPVVNDAAAITGSLLFAAALLAGAAKLDAHFRRSARSAIPGPRPPARPSILPWVARHPWLSASGLALAINGILIPLDGGRVVDLPSRPLAVGVLLGGALLLIFVAYGIQTAWWSGIRALFAGARRSSFFAGAVTAGSLIITAIALLVGNALVNAAKSLADYSAPATPLCEGSFIQCSREIFGSSIAASGPRPFAPSAGASLPEPPPSFERCVEELHSGPPTRPSARDEGLTSVFRIVRDRDAAEDIVHATVLSVCLGNQRPAELRPYFFKSVINAAKREARYSRRYCPLLPDEPLLPPSGCAVDSYDTVQPWMEASAYQALCSLSADDRRVIELHLWDKLSHAEIAQRVGCSEQAARQRYSRAMRELRAQFHRRCQ